MSVTQHLAREWEAEAGPGFVTLWKHLPRAQLPTLACTGSREIKRQ